MGQLFFSSFRFLLKQQFLKPPGLHQLSDLVEEGEEDDLVSGCESVGMLVRKTSGIHNLLCFISFLKFSTSKEMGFQALSINLFIDFIDLLIISFCFY